MANETIHDQAAVTSADASDELLVWVAASSLTKKITKANLLGGTMTGGGTVATGGYTLTVPATGTAALLGTAQSFTAAKTFSAGVISDTLKAASAAGVTITDDGDTTGIVVADGGKVGVKRTPAFYNFESQTNLAAVAASGDVEISADASGSAATAGGYFTARADGGYVQFAMWGTTKSATVFGEAVADSGDLRTIGATKFLLGTDNAAPLIFGVNNALAGAFTAVGLGIGTTDPLAKLAVIQSSSTAAIPAIKIYQADESEEVFQFDLAVGTGKVMDTAALGTYYGRMRVSINGTNYYYMPLYNA